MPKLVVVAGPLRGNSYDLHDGENAVGRVAGNDIVLQSQKVSKKHCVLSVVGSNVSVSDAGSSNGTFVNGVLTKNRKLMPGDRISVGEYVLELAKPAQKLPARPASTGAKIIPMQSRTGLTGLNPLGMTPPPAAGAATPAAAGAPMAPAPPQDIVEKVKFYFDKYVINFLYTLNEKHQWNVLVKGLLAVLVAFSAAVSVFPTIDKTQEVLLQEARNRARALARLMVDHNSLAVLERQESKLDIGFAEREDGIVAVYIVDMDNRIMAPGKKLNQSLTDGQEGRFAQNARKHFTKSERYFSMPYWRNDGSQDPTLPALEGNIMGVAEPIKILDPSKGKNVTVAMAIVFLDLNGIVMNDEATMLFFLTAIVLSSIMAVAVYTSIHRLTLRPLNQLNQDIDKAIRGDASGINITYKMSEIEPLVEVMNTVIARMGASGSSAVAVSNENPEDFLNPMRFAAERSSNGVMLLTAERKLFYLNPRMEEITGIRFDGFSGADVADVCRDEAFALMINDLIGRAPQGTSEGAIDTMEFSGVNYQIEALGLGSLGGSPKGFVISLREAA